MRKASITTNSMIETALIDGDIVCYRCAAATEHEPEDIACWQVSEMMRRILHETNAMQYKCFLTGSNNFRYSVYPEYKANRKDLPKPKHLQAVREHLVTAWNAKVTDGVEADDMLGIEQCSVHDGDSVIATIDKDLLMIPGRHYNFVKQEHRTVSPLEGLRFFYGQLIMGDRSDNIPGYDGKMRVKVPKFLEEDFYMLETMDNECDMYEYVLNMYTSSGGFHNHEEIMQRNAKVLWIMRKDNDFWQKPEITMEEPGQKDVTIPS